MTKQLKKMALVIICIMFSMTATTIYASTATDESEAVKKAKDFRKDVLELFINVQQGVEQVENKFNPISEKCEEHKKSAQELSEKLDFDSEFDTLEEIKCLSDEAYQIESDIQTQIKSSKKQAKGLIKEIRNNEEKVEELLELLSQLKDFFEYVVDIRINSIEEYRSEYQELQKYIEDIFEEYEQDLEKISQDNDEIISACEKIQSKSSKVSESLEEFKEKQEKTAEKLKKIIDGDNDFQMDDEVLKYGDYEVFNASAYCPCYGCSEGHGHNTAMMKRARELHTVAASKAYDFGTRIYAEKFADKANNGMFTVEDRGGAIKGNKLDIFMEEHYQTEQFGRKNLECYVFDVDYLEAVLDNYNL